MSFANALGGGLLWKKRQPGSHSPSSGGTSFFESFLVPLFALPFPLLLLLAALAFGGALSKVSEMNSSEQ